VSADPTRPDYDPGRSAPGWVAAFALAAVGLGVFAASCGR
jgi:hypothetical protein